MRQLGMGLVCMILAAPALAAPEWVEVASPHFRVLSNGGDKAGRRVAWQFEQIRAALEKLWPWARLDSGPPLVIFAARDEKTLRSLGPQYWEGHRFRPASFSAAGSAGQFIALRTDLREPDDAGENPYRSAYWAYVSVVLNRSFPVRLPAWYSRGMAEMMSNTVVRDKELHVGRLLSNNLRTLRERALVPLGEFLAADARSPWVLGEAAIQVFDAQAWAFVHYLTFADDGAHQARLNRFMRLLLDGTASDIATREALGDPEPLFQGMRAYVQRSIFQYTRFMVSLGVRAETFPARPLSPADAALARAGMLVASGRPAEARNAAAEARQADPTSPGPLEIEGLLLDGEGREDDARAALQKAVEAGSKNAFTHYRLAQLLWVPQPGAELQARLASLLEKARALAPDEANTLSFLAEVKVGLGQVTEAIDLARRAVSLEPAVSYHRRALAGALASGERLEEAARIARTAVDTAATDDERRFAEEVVDYVSRSRPRPRPSVSLPAPSPAAAAAATERRETRPDSLAIQECIAGKDSACAQAAPLLESACAEEASACSTLGSLFEGGFGVMADPVRAGRLYEKGCEAGDPRGCARHAVLQFQGRGVSLDPVKAVATLQALCARGVQHGCIGWAQILVQRGGTAEVAKARELLEAACGAQASEACRLLASLDGKR